MLCVIAVITVYCRRRKAHIYEPAYDDWTEDNDSIGEDVTPTFSVPHFIAKQSQERVFHQVGQRVLSDQEMKKDLEMQNFSPRSTLDIRLADNKSGGSAAASSSLVDRVTHNARKIFQRPKSLTTVSGPRPLDSGNASLEALADLQKGGYIGEERKKANWFGQDPFSSFFASRDAMFGEEEDGGDSDIETSVHFRRVPNTPSTRKVLYDTNDDLAAPAQASSGRERTPSDDANDDFVRQLSLLSEAASGERVAHDLSIDLNDMDTSLSGIVSEANRSASADSVDTVSTTESAREAIHFISSALVLPRSGGK